MSSETSSNPEIDDAERSMRQSLGLGRSVPVQSSSSDPNRGARQAIRSQAAAREYVERQLAHAQGEIGDLRNKLHQARIEKDTAVAAARSAMAAKIVAERSLKATEASLSEEKTTRECQDRTLRESQAMVKELERRLQTVRQALQTSQAEVAAERQARLKARETAKVVTAALKTAAPKSAVPTDPGDVALPQVPRGRGRPRKMGVVQPVTVSPKAAMAVNAITGVDNQTNRRPEKPGRSRAPMPVKWWIKSR